MLPYRWQKVTDRAAFAARDGAGALTYNGRMWLLGGWNPDDKVNFPHICNNEIWSSTDGEEWKLEARHAPWAGRHCGGHVLHRGRMWIVGSGDATNGGFKRDTWASDDGVRWERVTDDAPWHPRALHYAVSYADRLWVMGGQATARHDTGEDERFYSDVWSSPDGARWEKVADGLPWGPRSMMPGSIVFQDRMWILGGGTFESFTRPERTYYHDAWSSADGVAWDRVLDRAPWHPRQFHDAIVFDGRMWIIGGWHRDTGNINDVWHSADGRTWEELPGTPWAPRHASSLFVHRDALWVVAGNNMEPDAWKLVRV